MAFAELTITAVLTILPCVHGSVKTGLDDIGEHKQLFNGRRIGIITNHTAYSSRGQYIVDVFGFPRSGVPRNIDGARITALFSPEHGIYGAQEAGEAIAPMEAMNSAATSSMSA